MEINYITGCIYNNLSIDGKPVEDISNLELKTICKQIVDESDNDALQQIIIDYLYSIGPIDFYTCDDCGDSVETFKVILKD